MLKNQGMYRLSGPKLPFQGDGPVLGKEFISQWTVKGFVMW